MHRRYIAFIAALSITITAFASAPARASDDAARLIGAIAGIAILGAIIHDQNKKKKERASVYRAPKVAAPPVIYQVPQVDARPLPQRVSRKLLPQQCVRRVEGENRSFTAFGARCLHRNFAFADSLPEFCVRTVSTERGPRAVYGARCLRREGYQLARN